MQHECLVHYGPSGAVGGERRRGTNFVMFLMSSAYEFSLIEAREVVKVVPKCNFRRETLVFVGNAHPANVYRKLSRKWATLRGTRQIRIFANYSSCGFGLGTRKNLLEQVTWIRCYNEIIGRFQLNENETKYECKKDSHSLG